LPIHLPEINTDRHTEYCIVSHFPTEGGVLVRGSLFYITVAVVLEISIQETTKSSLFGNIQYMEFYQNGASNRKAFNPKYKLTLSKSVF